MCSYWRARFVPFSTPRGGMAPPSSLDFRLTVATRVGARNIGSRFQSVAPVGTAVTGPTTKGGTMYIGGGVLALIVIIVLLIWLL